MPAPVVESIDALLTVDPRALDDDELKRQLREPLTARARVEAAVLAAVSELDQRNAYVSDGHTEARAWIAHHAGVAPLDRGRTGLADEASSLHAGIRGGDGRGLDHVRPRPRH